MDAAHDPVVLLFLSLLWARETLPITLLVDSGADDSFINANLAQQVGLPLERLPEPKMVLDIDGGTLMRVTHRTVSVTLLVSVNHHECI